MTFDSFDLFVRIAGATLLLFVAAMLARARSHGAPGLLFLPLSIGLSAFLLNNSDGPSVFAGSSEQLTNLLAGLTVPVLWWFCLALFDRDFRPRAAALGVGAVWALLAILDRGSLRLGPLGPLVNYGQVGLGLAIVGHLCWKLLGDRDDDLVEWRRRARPWVVAVLGGLLLIDLAADLLLGFGWRPAWFALAQNLAIAAFAGWFGLAVTRAEPGLLFGAPPSRAGKPGNPRLAKKVAALIADEHLHLDPGLTFAEFAARSGHSARAVRDHINRDLGYDHFRAFINRHRVNEACRRLASPDHAGDKLIAIALDSGFASLASFNRCFRAATGRTPSDYRAAPAFEERFASF